MFGKLLKGLGTVVKVAGPLATGLGLGGPVGAGLAVVAQLAGGAEKKRGKAAEKLGAPAVHKATAPIAAIAAPTLLALALETFGVSGGQEVAGMACASPTALGGLAGIAALVNHVLGQGIERAQSKRPVPRVRKKR